MIKANDESRRKLDAIIEKTSFGFDGKKLIEEWAV